MVETKDLEVLTIELRDLTKDRIEEFLLSGLEYLVLLNQGRYSGVINSEILKQNGRVMSDYIICKGDIFKEARNYFEKKENRNQYLALVDSQGNLLTFLVWNQRKERSADYLVKQKQKLLISISCGNFLQFHNWDEYTNDYYEFLLRQGKQNNVIFTGRNWELNRYYNPYEFTKDEEKKNTLLVDNQGIYVESEEALIDSFLMMNEHYEKYRIFFWLDSLLCMYEVSSYLFEYGCQPDGYCELSSRREIKDFLGKRVVDLESLVEYDDILIVVENNREKAYLSKYISQDKIILFGNLIQLNTSLIENNTYQTWGTKKELDEFRKSISGCHIYVPYRNFKEENSKTVNGIILWENVDKKNYQNYRKYMESINRNVNLYSLKKVYETNGVSSGMMKIKIFDKAIRYKKKCLIYGLDSHYTNHWMRILEMFHLDYEFMEDKEMNSWNGYPVMSIYDLPYYDSKNVLVIINKPYGEFGKAVGLLKNYNFSLECQNAISIYEQLDNQNRGQNYIDLCAGPVPASMIRGKYPCYYVIGEDDRNDYRIMIVGGSTSDSTLYNYTSWPEELYKIFCREGKKVTIYNGAVGGYYSMQELAKVIRDARKIKPNVIISFSGTNDTGMLNTPEGYVNGSVGQNTENSFDNWIENERMMLYAAKQIGAKFYCVAQPQLFQKVGLDKYEKLFTKCIRNDSGIDQNWKMKVKGVVNNYSWLIDLTNILDEYTDVYFDVAHTTEKGNEIISQHIYNTIFKNGGEEL